MNEKNILVCEDDEGISELAQIVLEGKGYNVTILNESNDIYTKIEEVNPSLILLDLWMPGLTGDEIARHLKANARTRDIPIVFISANKDTERIARQAGANAFLAKPFDIEALENIVDEHILK